MFGYDGQNIADASPYYIIKVYNFNHWMLMLLITYYYVSLNPLPDSFTQVNIIIIKITLMVEIISMSKTKA